jgi:membrane-bound serine protease (ClpP class)
VLGLILLCLTLGRDASAQNAVAPDATTEETARAPRTADLVVVPLPITGTVDTQVKQAIARVLARQRPAASRPLVVLEFRSEPDQSGRGSEFERCLSLARYLSGNLLRRARTVAFLPQTVQGHAVLAVLACEEIIMEADATLGDAGLEESNIDEVMRRGYREIADRRRTVPAAVALGMLDQELAVHKVETLDGISFVLDSELDTLRQTTTVSAIESVIQPGDLGRFNGRELRLKYGFVSHLAQDRTELAAALKISPDAFQHDSAFDGDWRPVVVDIRGPISASLVSWIIRSTQQRIVSDDYNFLCIAVESPGGSAEESLRLANYIAALDPGNVRTVAFVPFEARADAAIVALACDQLVMAPEAVLGGPGARVVAARDQMQLKAAVRAVTKAKGRSWSLAAALADQSLTVYRYSERSTGQVRYFSETERLEQPDPDQWLQQEEIQLDEGLTGRQAERLQLVRHQAEDFAQFTRIYGLEAELDRVQPNWAHRAIEQLASPRLAAFLLFVACFAFFAEFSHPGLGVPGFVSALCFLVYFWSNFLHGTAGWLEVLLFLGGLISIALEFFVLPGLGVFGLGGGFLVVASIVLASQTFVVPRNSYQLGQMPSSLATVVAALAGAVVALVMMRRYLPETPLLRRLLLAPLDADDLEELDRRESLADYDYLVGKRGRTVTPLNPSGKASFGDDVISVITDGAPIDDGSNVTVVSVHGNRVLVKPIKH